MAERAPGGEAADLARARPVLDLDAIHAALGDDPRAVKALLASWVAINQRDVEDLRAKLAAHDAEGARSTAHRMKGAAHLVGARAFAGACEQVERLARARGWARLPDAEAELLDQLGAVEAAIDALDG